MAEPKEGTLELQGKTAISTRSNFKLPRKSVQKEGSTSKGDKTGLEGLLAIKVHPLGKMNSE